MGGKVEAFFFFNFVGYFGRFAFMYSGNCPNVEHYRAKLSKKCVSSVVFLLDDPLIGDDA